MHFFRSVDRWLSAPAWMFSLGRCWRGRRVGRLLCVPGLCVLGLCTLGCFVLAFLVNGSAGRAGGAEPVAVVSDAGVAETFRVERTDGTTLLGALSRIGADGVALASAGQDLLLPLDQVRVVARRNAAVLPAQPPALRSTWIDGSTLEAEDISWDGKQALLITPGGPIEVPVERLRTLDWSGGSGWQTAVPEATESDLLVVGTPAAHEFVECAITVVSPETVTVLLDDETIAVKRAKIIGLQWLRAQATNQAPRGIVVDIDGGSLRAGKVVWTPTGLVLDDVVRVPAPLLARIDFAADRTLSLTGLPPERLDVEPYFGSLAALPGFAPYFAPRPVVASGDFPREGLVVRPRTVAVWRVPADSRRFRTVVAPAAGRMAAGKTLVTISVDDSEAFRREIDAGVFPIDGVGEGLPIELEIAGARRLTVTVDYGTGGDLGSPVRFTTPVIEK